MTKSLTDKLREAAAALMSQLPLSEYEGYLALPPGHIYFTLASLFETGCFTPYEVGYLLRNVKQDRLGLPIYWQDLRA